MNIKEYISSGIIEGYVLGGLGKQESQEVECMAHIYPEIKEELIKQQNALEKYLNEFAEVPPKEIKSKILSQIGTNSEAKLVSITKEETKNNFWKYSAAAGFGLFIVTSVFVMLQKGRNKELSDKIKVVNQQLNKDSAEKKIMNNSLIAQSSLLAMYADPSNKMITLNGMKEKDPSAKAMICWNKNSKEVYIEVDKLPEVPKGMQYQLWAIVDGKPVDLGTMDTSDPNDKTFHKMKATDNPQAFAVTLEVKGGSKAPTLNEMYVMGKV